MIIVFFQARFDRHFVRDLTWSRHQLEELAESRFRAAQLANSSSTSDGSDDQASLTSFSDLFKKASPRTMSYLERSCGFLIQFGCILVYANNFFPDLGAIFLPFSIN